MLRAILYCLGAAVLFSSIGCEYQMIEEAMQAREKSIDNLIGADMKMIEGRFGYADSISESLSGNRVFVYSATDVDSSSVSCSVSKDGSSSCSGGDVSTDWCKTFFEVDEQNTIQNITFKGNDCETCYGGGICWTEIAQEFPSTSYQAEQETAESKQ